jgi:prepilin-type N-terminal cleavage/methylation domain-containing protein
MKIFLLKKENRGFTLTEMLISITLFTIVTTIAFTALYSIMDANTKAKTIKLVVNNLNIAMESMSRELRVGYDYSKSTYDSGASCDTVSSGSTTIYFKTKDGCDAYYQYNSTNKTIKKKIGKKDGSGNCPTLSAISEASIVGDDVLINGLKFYITGVGPSGDIQPRVVILLQGETARSDIDTKFNIQTTVSQRKSDQ